MSQYKKTYDLSLDHIIGLNPHTLVQLPRGFNFTFNQPMEIFSTSDALDGSYSASVEFITCKGNNVVYQSKNDQTVLNINTESVGLLSLSTPIYSSQNGAVYLSEPLLLAISALDPPDITLACLDVPGGRVLGKVEDHNSAVVSTVFSHDNRLLVSVDVDGMIIFTDVSTCAVVSRLRTPISGTRVIVPGGFTKDTKGRNTGLYLFAVGGASGVSFISLDPVSGRSTCTPVHNTVGRDITSLLFLRNPFGISAAQQLHGGRTTLFGVTENDWLYCGTSGGEIGFVHVRTCATHSWQLLDLNSGAGIAAMQPLSFFRVTASGSSSDPFGVDERALRQLVQLRQRSSIPNSNSNGSEALLLAAHPSENYKLLGLSAPSSGVGQVGGPEFFDFLVATTAGSICLVRHQIGILADFFSSPANISNSAANAALSIHAAMAPVSGAEAVRKQETLQRAFQKLWRVQLPPSHANAGAVTISAAATPSLFAARMAVLSVTDNGLVCCSSPISSRVDKVVVLFSSHAFIQQIASFSGYSSSKVNSAAASPAALAPTTVVPANIMAVSTQRGFEDILASAASDGTVRLWSLSNLRGIGLAKPQIDGVGGVPHPSSGGNTTSSNISTSNRGSNAVALNSVHTAIPTSLSFGGAIILSGWNDGAVRAHLTLPQIGQDPSHPNPTETTEIAPIWSIPRAHPVSQSAVSTSGATQHQGVSTVALSRNQRFLLSGGYDHVVNVWDVRTREAVSSYNDHIAKVSTVLVQNDDAHAISASLDKTVMQWDLMADRCSNKVSLKTGGVLQADFNFDDSLVLTSSSDNFIAAWDFRTNSSVISFQSIKGDGYATAIVSAFSSNLFATGGSDGSIKVWDIRNTFAPLVEQSPHSKYVSSIRWTGDDRQIISAGNDGSIAVWNLFQI